MSINEIEKQMDYIDDYSENGSMPFNPLKKAEVQSCFNQSLEASKPRRILLKNVVNRLPKAKKNGKQTFARINEEEMHKEIAIINSLSLESHEYDSRLCRRSLSENFFGGVSLRGVSLRHSLLNGADLSACVNLTSQQLGGADLTNASLPESVTRSFDDSLEFLQDLNKKIGSIETALISSLAVILMIVYSTDDLSLLTNIGSAPIPVLGISLPPIYFACVAPLLPMGFFLWIHFYAQQYWQTLSNLPAFFTDGTPITRKSIAWLGTGWLEKKFPALALHHEPLQLFASNVLRFTLYALTPIALALVSWKCFILHTWYVSAWHLLYIFLCVTLSLYFYYVADKTLAISDYSEKKSRKVFSYVALVTLILLAYLCDSTNEISGWSFLRHGWPTSNHNLQLPHSADISGRDVSKRKDDWIEPDVAESIAKTVSSKSVVAVAADRQNIIAHEREKELPLLLQIKPINFYNNNLNSAIANYTFLVNADLFQSDIRSASLMHSNLQNTNMRDCNLQGTDLSYANLQFSVMDNAKLTPNIDGTIVYANKTQFQFSHMDGAKLLYADLRGADFSFASMKNCDLTGCLLSGTDFSYTDLSNAIITNTIASSFIVDGVYYLV